MCTEWLASASHMLWLSTQPSLDGYMLSTRRENDTIALERLGSRETVSLRRCEGKWLSSATVQVTRKGRLDQQAMVITFNCNRFS